MSGTAVPLALRATAINGSGRIAINLQMVTTRRADVEAIVTEWESRSCAAVGSPSPRAA